MATDNLYRIQDADRPMYVVASSYKEAIDRYIAFVAEEGELPLEECEEPDGVVLVAPSNELLLRQEVGDGG